MRVTTKYEVIFVVTTPGQIAVDYKPRNAESRLLYATFQDLSVLFLSDSCIFQSEIRIHHCTEYFAYLYN